MSIFGKLLGKKKSPTIKKAVAKPAVTKRIVLKTAVKKGTKKK